MGKVGLMDLEKNFSFCGAYHSNPINVAVHMVFVCSIFFTALLLLYFTPPLFHLPPFLLPLLGRTNAVALPLFLNLGFVLTLIYASFYVSLDPRAGSLTALLCVFCWIGSSFVADWLGLSLAWKVVLFSQLICWTGQVIGHGVVEKRAPALLDNLIQAFLMAPFFVLLEALQSFCGYEPYPGFGAKVEARIEAEASEWDDNKRKLIS